MDGYAARKQHYQDMITLYGRKPVLELLRDPSIDIHKLHLASSNRQTAEIREIIEQATAREIPIREHSRDSLSRISRNGRQDQGVALDLTAPAYQPLDSLTVPDGSYLLLDRVTNPQNLGMILRTVAASPLGGIILARQGNAALDPLVFKASAGCLLKATIYHCESSTEAVAYCRNLGMKLFGLSSHGQLSISEVGEDGVFVLGNESNGISPEILDACDHQVVIPLANGVESLNVSAAATLVAFRSLMQTGLGPVSP